jgi:hypothetical protein
MGFVARVPEKLDIETRDCEAVAEQARAQRWPAGAGCVGKRVIASYGNDE